MPDNEISFCLSLWVSWLGKSGDIATCSACDSIPDAPSASTSKLSSSQLRLKPRQYLLSDIAGVDTMDRQCDFERIFNGQLSSMNKLDHQA